MRRKGRSNREAEISFHGFAGITTKKKKSYKLQGNTYEKKNRKEV